MTTKEREITKEEALEALNKKRAEELDKCKQEISEVLQRYDCSLQSLVVIRGNMINSEVTLAKNN